jgi:hypothetical protein
MDVKAVILTTNALEHVNGRALSVMLFLVAHGALGCVQAGGISSGRSLRSRQSSVF